MASSTGIDFSIEREKLVRQLQRQGIRNPAILNAIQSVPREAFLPPELHEFAYQNTPLPIGNEQTISQPFIVALMATALELVSQDRVLEIGTGSGYAAAVLSQIAKEVYTIERYPDLAESARARFLEAGFQNIYVMQADGTLGWSEHAPFDAIVVAAGSPGMPEPLLKQLAVGGRLVLPVGENRSLQRLVRVRKSSEDDYKTEDLGDVRFVPLIGAAGWEEEETEWDGHPVQPIITKSTIAERIGNAAIPFEVIEECQLDSLLERIGDSRLVLIGEATHGTSEFYRMRAHITRELIAQRNFNFVAVEADWPDAARISEYVQDRAMTRPPRWQAFARFPTWMWRNHEVQHFVEWLRDYNVRSKSQKKVAFYGLDLYSLFTSLHAVLEFLEEVDPQAAGIARERYGCLTPWEGNAETYGRAAISGRYRECEAEVVATLKDLLQRRNEYAAQDGEQFFDASQNAKLVADAEQYYRVMYYGGVESWNLRDRHMFATLQAIMAFHDPGAKGVIWAHNSHLGNAAATEMAGRGETNIGQLCRAEFGKDAYLIGQTTDHGTVAAAHNWESKMEIMQIRPAREESYERLCHNSRVQQFQLPLRKQTQTELSDELMTPRMQRAIGVVYRPQTEVQSHYFYASLPKQFDELIWFDETHAVRPLLTHEVSQHPPPHPFALID